MRNWFTLDGVDSRDFGVYISGQGTFSAPGRDYNMIPVPGRNGDLVGPEKRFLNGTLTYPAFIYANFDANIEAFRNFLLSLVGYHDLVDSYHPDEIRKVLFKGPFEPNVQRRNDAGSFDITFDCKPQRFLASGNEVTTFESAGATETFSGSIITFENPGGATVTALSAAINPVQDLHGYSNPWPAGGGKNLLQNTGTSKTENGITWTVNTDGTISAKGTASGNSLFVVNQFNFDGQSYILTGCPPDGAQSTKWQIQVLENLSGGALQADTGSGVTITRTGNLYIRCVVRSGNTVDFVFKPMIRLSSVSDATYAPYSNICPITGFDEANIVVSPTLDAQDGTTYTVSFGAAGTVYSGNLDVLTGVLTVDHQMFLFDSSDTSNWTVNNNNYFQRSRPSGFMQTTAASWANKFYSNILDTTTRSGSASSVRNNSFYAGSSTIVVRIDSFNHDLTTFQSFLSNTGLQILVPIDAQTYQLTPTEIALLTGTNNIWSDTGDVTATIAFPQDQFTITNPTLFDSQPLLRVYGEGTLGINSQSVTITQADEYTDIDCEMMDCYKGTENKNLFVQFTDYNFPVFKPGTNNISLSGITKVEITPRWWMV